MTRSAVRCCSSAAGSVEFQDAIGRRLGDSDSSTQVESGNSGTAWDSPSYAALTDVLQALRENPDAVATSVAGFHAAVRAVDQIAPPLLISRRLVRGPHAADAIEAIRRCAGPVATLEQYARENPQRLQSKSATGHTGLVLREVVDIRRAIAGRPRPLRELP